MVPSERIVALMPKKNAQLVVSSKMDDSASREPLAPVGMRPSRQLAKRADPAYTKFTTYIKKSTHLGVKTRLVSKQEELSDLVEDLLSSWLKENDSFT